MTAWSAKKALWTVCSLPSLFPSFLRFSGVPPSNLGNNTKLVDWMPQNDLLGEHIKKLPHDGRFSLQFSYQQPNWPHQFTVCLIGALTVKCIIQHLCKALFEPRCFSWTQPLEKRQIWFLNTSGIRTCFTHCWPVVFLFKIIPWVRQGRFHVGRVNIVEPLCASHEWGMCNNIQILTASIVFCNSVIACGEPRLQILKTSVWVSGRSVIDVLKGQVATNPTKFVVQLNSVVAHPTTVLGVKWTKWPELSLSKKKQPTTITSPPASKGQNTP